MMQGRYITVPDTAPKSNNMKSGQGRVTSHEGQTLAQLERRGGERERERGGGGSEGGGRTDGRERQMETVRQTEFLSPANNF